MEPAMTTTATGKTLTPAALRARRLELGISAVRVADALGVRLTEVGRWERGEVLPDPMRWRLLARMLHLDEEVPLATPPRRAEPDEVDVVIDLIGADPFVSIIDRRGVVAASRPRIRSRVPRALLLVATLLGFAALLTWAFGDLVGAITGR
jgi:transcriptional regulator with XRE-family HTH domain